MIARHRSGKPDAVRGLSDARALLQSALPAQLSEAARERRQHLLIRATHRDVPHQRLEAHRPLAFQRPGVGRLRLRHPGTVHAYELGLGQGVRAAHGPDVVRVDDPNAAPLYLSKSTPLLTARMNITLSIGLMSVPVGTMSTVTAILGS